MKALTVWQPHAHRIVLGEKRVENRNWRTTYRGPLLIHAGKSRFDLRPEHEEQYPDMAFGALIGCVELVESLPLIDLDAREASLQWAWVNEDPYTYGPCCWILESARRFPVPLPWRGQLHVFDVPDKEIRDAGLDDYCRPPAR